MKVKFRFFYTVVHDHIQICHKYFFLLKWHLYLHLDNFSHTADNFIAIFYFHHSFDFCQAPVDKSAPAENLGQVVFGERIRPSPYEINFLKDAGKCKTVCTKEYDSSKKEDVVKLDFLKKGMSMNYQHHWIVDNMPVNRYEEYFLKT